MENRKYPIYADFLCLFEDLLTEAAMKEYLAFMRWGETPQCVNCGSTEGIRTYSTPGMYDCRKCGDKQFSVLQGTIMERSAIPLKYWFWAMFEFCLDLTPSTKMAERHSVQQRTAYAMAQRFRIAQWFELNRKLCGNIYSDETELGSNPQRDLRNYWHQYYLKKLDLPTDNTFLVFGMIEGGQAKPAKPSMGIPAVPGGQVLLYVIDDTYKDTLQDLILHNTIYSESNLFTDGHLSYVGLDKYFQNHYRVLRNAKGLGKYDFESYLRKADLILPRFSAIEEDIKIGKYIPVTTNPIENIWAQLQNEYLQLFGYSREHAQLYLNEFMFRFNHRHLSLGEKFEILLHRCCNTPLYSVVEGKRKRTVFENKFEWENKRGGQHKWRPTS